MLDSLESSYKKEIIFIDRDRVYKDIFPSNNFNATAYQINLNEECKAYDLADLSTMYNQILDKLKNQDKPDYKSIIQVQDLICDIANLPLSHT